MAFFELLTQACDKIRGRGNEDFANYLCGFRCDSWDEQCLTMHFDDLIPEVHLYFMLLFYSKIAFVPLKAIRKFVFPEQSKGRDCRYTHIDQV
jgi:hypothetical protein